jgi:glycosyltransferase involved in cell wall biosynthesis
MRMVSSTCVLTGARVTIVLPSFALNGSERQAFLLARHLKEVERAEVLMVSVGAGGSIESLCETAQIRHTYFELWHKYRTRAKQVADVLRFARFLRREGTDIVLPYCMFQNILCALAWRMGGAKLCIWSQRDEGRSRVEGWVERLAVAQTPVFVSNSRHGAVFLNKALLVPPDRVHVISNGIVLSPASLSPTEWRARLGLPEKAFVASMVATLHRYKDHATLISAWRHVVTGLLADNRQGHLLLAGLWEDRYLDLVQQVRSLGLEQQVHFLGEVLDIPGLLSACDLFVFSSVSEGVPNAVLEAMAAGLAVVGTDYAGIREAVGGAGAPLLARMADAEDLAAKILLAARSDELRTAHGRLGKEYVEAQYGLERMCCQTVDLMKRSLGAPR